MIQCKTENRPCYDNARCQRSGCVRKEEHSVVDAATDFAEVAVGYYVVEAIVDTLSDVGSSFFD